MIDPGPDDEAHLAALLARIAGRPVSHIFVSHTHRDHSPLAGKLKAERPAPSSAPRDRTALPGRSGSARSTRSTPAPTPISCRMWRSPTTAWSTAATGRCATILTPGHAANHAAFALEGTGILFSADHVMGWSTSIVAPPDGAMADYMASLDKLLTRRDRLFLPGHGGPVKQPRKFMRGLKAHRKMRERAILERLQPATARSPRWSRRSTATPIRGCTARPRLSVLAHLEDLVARGVVKTEGRPALESSFWV